MDCGRRGLAKIHLTEDCQSLDHVAIPRNVLKETSRTNFDNVGHGVVEYLSGRQQRNGPHNIERDDVLRLDLDANKPLETAAQIKVGLTGVADADESHIAGSNVRIAGHILPDDGVDSANDKAKYTSELQLALHGYELHRFASMLDESPHAPVLLKDVWGTTVGKIGLEGPHE